MFLFQYCTVPIWNAFWQSNNCNPEFWAHHPSTMALGVVPRICDSSALHSRGESAAEGSSNQRSSAAKNAFVLILNSLTGVSLKPTESAYESRKWKHTPLRHRPQQSFGLSSPHRQRSCGRTRAKGGAAMEESGHLDTAATWVRARAKLSESSREHRTFDCRSP